MYRHNILACNPLNGYHGVNKVAKTVNIAKVAEKGINCISSRPALIFSPKRGGVSTFLTPPSKEQKSGFQVEGGSGSKTHWGMHSSDKKMILQGVQLTIQPLEVGYANMPEKAQKGGMWRFPTYCGGGGGDLVRTLLGMALTKKKNF